jgi:hypothetical protein
VAPPHAERAGTPPALPGGETMKDILFTLLTIGFFALSWLYARSGERL